MKCDIKREVAYYYIYIDGVIVCDNEHSEGKAMAFDTREVALEWQQTHLSTQKDVQAYFEATDAIEARLNEVYSFEIKG